MKLPERIPLSGRIPVTQSKATQLSTVKLKKIESHFWLLFYDPSLTYLVCHLLPIPSYWIPQPTCPGPGWGRTACGTGRKLDRLPREDICSPGSDFSVQTGCCEICRTGRFGSQIQYLSVIQSCIQKGLRVLWWMTLPFFFGSIPYVVAHTPVGRSHLNVPVTVRSEVSLAACMCQVQDGLGMSGHLKKIRTCRNSAILRDFTRA